MARKPATLGLSSNIELRAAAPLDGRQKVETIADLTAPESFPYHFVGMETYCVEAQKWYTLRYDDPTNIDNWVENGSGRDGKDGSPIIVDSVTKQGRENIITLVWKDMYGADHSIDVTILDGQKGDSIVGPAGPQGEPGESFTIRSQYATETELRQHHPTGNEGDAYFVGDNESTPHLYFWDEELGDWHDMGEIIGTQGPRGESGADGFSPDIAVAETSDSSYKLRITNANGSYLTPNLKGNLAPIDTIDPASAVPVQSKTIAAALDTKQPKILATPVAVRDYLTKQLVSQTTVQATLEALAACVNYEDVPAQLIGRFDDEEHLPTGDTVKPGSIALVGAADSDKKKTYIYTEQKKWEQTGGTSDDNMVELDANEIDAIWSSSGDTIYWISGTALPADFGSFGACVYDGKINILGGYGVMREIRNNGKYHYQLNNGVWESVSTLPSSFFSYYESPASGQAVVFDDKIVILNGSGMMAWDGENWVKDTNVPRYFSGGVIVVYDNKIHVIGGCVGNSGDVKKHYVWDGTEWSELSDAPIDLRYCAYAVYDNKIHIITHIQETGYVHYTWDGSSWTEINDTFPASFDPSLAVIYDDKLNVIGNWGRFEYDDENNSWIKKENVDMHIGNGTRAVVLNGHIHIMGGEQVNNVGSPRGHRILQ